MMKDVRKRLNGFAIMDIHTEIRIREALIKTLKEITSLNECGIISDREFIDLGKELWMNL